MKKIILMFMVLTMTLAAEAQVKPTVLGDKHAMLKVKQGEFATPHFGQRSEKYLLLPV